MTHKRQLTQLKLGLMFIVKKALENNIQQTDSEREHKGIQELRSYKIDTLTSSREQEPKIQIVV